MILFCQEIRYIYQMAFSMLSQMTLLFRNCNKFWKMVVISFPDVGLMVRQHICKVNIQPNRVLHSDLELVLRVSKYNANIDT